MRVYKRPCFLGLAILVLALSLAATACKPSMFRRRQQTCTIETDGALKLNVNTGFGGIVIKTINPSTNNPERIEVRGRNGDAREKGGIYEISAFEETAEVYVEETRAIILTGQLGRDLQLTNHQGPFTISGHVEHVNILNHQGPLTVQGGMVKSMDILNQEGDLRLDRVSDRVSITNLKGKLDATVYGNLDLLNKENGDTSITAHGNINITNLAGNLQATAYRDFKILNQESGNTTITSYGDVSIQNFDVELEKGTRFELLMKNRPVVERVLKEKGHTLYIDAFGFGVSKLHGINARTVCVRGSGLNTLNLFALQTELRQADGVTLQNIQSPLKMAHCRNGILNGLEMDFTLENCSEMQLNPRDNLGPRGTLKQCNNIVFWNTPPDRVSQTRCQRVIFARQAQTPPTPPAGVPADKVDRPEQADRR